MGCQPVRLKTLTTINSELRKLSPFRNATAITDRELVSVTLLLEAVWSGAIVVSAFCVISHEGATLQQNPQYITGWRKVLLR